MFPFNKVLLTDTENPFYLYLLLFFVSYIYFGYLKLLDIPVTMVKNTHEKYCILKDVLVLL